MAPHAEALTSDQFISLLMIGDMKPRDFSPFIPIGDEMLLIKLGYIEKLRGRLSMTLPGRVRIARIEANPLHGSSARN
jgi:hypothetical protein